MTTTALFIELLLTGLQAAIWIILLILCFFGYDWVNVERLKGFEVVIAALSLPVVYPLGVFIDYLADQVFRPWELKIRGNYQLDSTQTALGLLILTKDSSLANHFSYARSRIRISRSSALNFALITFFSVLFTVTRCGHITNFPFRRVLLLEIVIGASLAILAALSWQRFNHSFFNWVVRGYELKARMTAGASIEAQPSDDMRPSAEENVGDLE